MPPSQTSSFIPKRNAGSKPRSARRYNFFVLSIISYALFCAAPVASIAVFIYERHAENKLAAAVQNLEAQIETFSDSDLSLVVAYDERLILSRALIDSHVSFVSLLSILESATAGTVQFKDIEITRTSKDTLAVSAGLTTSALDGALFQRGVYAVQTDIASTSFSDVTLLLPTDGAEGTEIASKSVDLQADFAFAADKILYTPYMEVSEITAVATTSTTSNETPL